MVAFKIEDFAGMIPRRSDRLLPVNYGAHVSNAKLLGGELNAYNRPLPIQYLNEAFVVRSVFRLPSSPSDVWMAWDVEGVDVLPGPLVNDAYDRFYWTGDGAPKMSTRAEIAASTAARPLGIAGPTTALADAPSGGTGNSESRAYVYTFITDLGEESQPSPPDITTGKEDDTWNLSSIDVSPDSRVVKRRIYRSVTGAGSVDYRFVADINDNTTTTYADSDTDVSDGLALPSTSWAPPPSGLAGLRLMPNGFFVAFSGRDLYFSEPYRPHAWPVEYVLSTDDDIVGLGVVGSTCVVITESGVYVATGTTPANISFLKLDIREPILSAGSIVEMADGVYYAGTNGLVAVTPNGAGLITDDLISKQDWNDEFFPSAIKAVRYKHDQYLAMYAANKGFLIDPQEGRRAIVFLDLPLDPSVLHRDRYTADIYMVADNYVHVFDPLNTEATDYDWLSKVFDFPQPVNFGAAHVKFSSAGAALTTELATLYTQYNTERFAAGPLQPLGFGPIGGVKTFTLTDEVDYLQTRAPIGGSPLIDLSFYENLDFAVTLQVFADDILRLSKTLTQEGIIRLPSGYKAHLWQFRLTGNMPLFSLAVAETRMELMRV